MIVVLAPLFVLAVADRPAPACAKLRDSILTDLVSRMETAPNNALRLTTQGALLSYWGTICRAERESASISVVSRISRLLRIEPARFSTAKMLYDVRENLAAAGDAIDKALVDQKRLDDEMEKAGPVLNVDQSYAALRCIERLIQNRVKDAHWCSALHRARLHSD